MGLFTSINTSATGLTAQRLRLDVIADNLANVNTTRTADGGPYRRSRVIFQAKPSITQWYNPFTPGSVDGGIGRGVKVKGIEKDMEAELKYKFDPTHPDAIRSGPKKGMVALPNVNEVDEMVDMIAASRAYEANLSVIEGSKSMFMRALQIGR